MFLLPALLLAASAGVHAANRVFTRASTECLACLGETETVCPGPLASDQFNDCFCSVGDKGLAWPEIVKCLTSGDAPCKKDEYNVLSDWGAHCFAYKDDEEEEICVDSTQDDKLLMSVADFFCTEFLTLTSASATATGASSSKPTTTDDESRAATSTETDSDETTAESTSMETETSTTESTSTSSSAEPTNTDSGNNSDSGASAGNGNANGGGNSSNEDGDEDGGVAALSPLGLGGAAALALSVSGFIMQLF